MRWSSGFYFLQVLFLLPISAVRDFRHSIGVAWLVPPVEYLGQQSASEGKHSQDHKKAAI